MSKFAVVLFAWYFVVSGQGPGPGTQFGPFKVKSDCEDIAKEQWQRIIRSPI